LVSLPVRCSGECDWPGRYNCPIWFSFSEGNILRRLHQVLVPIMQSVNLRQHFFECIFNLEIDIFMLSSLDKWL
jgi:hypothetical protein